MVTVSYEPDWHVVEVLDDGPRLLADRGAVVIRVPLVDDQALLRAGMRGLLEIEDGIEVVGGAGDGEEAVCLARDTRPAVIPMDVDMPRLDGVQAYRTGLVIAGEPVGSLATG